MELEELITHNINDNNGDIHCNCYKLNEYLEDLENDKTLSKDLSEEQTVMIHKLMEECGIFDCMRK